MFASGAGPGKALGVTEPVRKLYSGCNVKFGVDATEMVFDGLRADGELAGGLPVGHTCGNQPSDGQFLRG